MDIDKVSSTVRMILQKYPETRDSDELLVLKVWGEHRPEIRNPAFSFHNFARGFINREYHSFEGIRRARQRCQEEFPDLRGKMYGLRKTEIAEKAKEQLKSDPLNKGMTP